jgi:hypothetical protein
MAADIPRELPVSRKAIRPPTESDITTLLEGTDIAWAQYKRGQGTLITSDDELDAFIDSL